MRRAVLLYNPASGRAGERLRIIHQVAAELRAQSVDVTTCATEGPGTAGRQALEAAAFADTIFACGGDGTVHEVIQGLAFHPKAVLGIIPMGSANVLARHLQLSLDPIRAAQQQMDRTPSLVPLGHVTYRHATGERSRYFIVMAGAGPDGALVYNMLASGKHRLGRAMYYLRAGHLFLRSRFAPFPLHCTDTQGIATSMRAVSAMAVRVGDLGGLFGPLIRGASVEDPEMLLTAALAPGHLSLAAWFGMSWLRLSRWNPYVRNVQVSSFECGEGEGLPVQVQADGEWLGRTPMTVKLIPSALRLLMPTAPVQTI